MTIIDYGIGNLRSIEKAFEAVGVEVLRTDDVGAIAEADRLVLPGVGAFGACIGEIRRRNLEAPIHDAVERGVPFLGVCVGLQLLFEESEERGTHRGLGLLPGRVVRFNGITDDDGTALKIPHMGWNTLVPHRASALLDGLDDGTFVYFVHSYHAVADRPEDVLAHTSYGIDFPAVVARNNVFGVQFHPEKSQHAGLRILQNFAQL
jgi:glutamine amidotransferase